MAQIVEGLARQYDPELEEQRSSLNTFGADKDIPFMFRHSKRKAGVRPDFRDAQR